MGCPPKVQSALKSVSGVDGVTVDYAAKTAVVTCNSGSCDTAAMVAALEAAGYGATVHK